MLSRNGYIAYRGGYCTYGLRQMMVDAGMAVGLDRVAGIVSPGRAKTAVGNTGPRTAYHVCRTASKPSLPSLLYGREYVLCERTLLPSV